MVKITPELYAINQTALYGSNIPVQLRGVPVAFQTLATQTSDFTIATFDTEFDGDQTHAALTAPLEGIVPQTEKINLYRGLGKLVNTGSVLHARSYRLGNDTVSRLRAATSDMRGLLDVLPTAGNEHAGVHLYDELSVADAVREQLLEMRTTDIMKMSHQLGVDIDELALYKKAGKRNRTSRYDHGQRLQLRLYDLEDIGLDTEQLRRQLIDTEFFRTMVRNGDSFETVYLPASELNPETATRTKYVEREKALPPLDDTDTVPRFRIAMRVHDGVRHIAVPMLVVAQIRTKADSPVTHMPELYLGGGRQEFDPITNTMRHMSPLLGAVIALGQQDPTLLQVPLDKIYDRNSNNGRKTLPLPHEAGATAPLLAAAFAHINQALLRKVVRAGQIAPQQRAVGKHTVKALY